MANGSFDKVIQDLNRRFAAPLPEFYKRRIIVWHDEDREFEDRISDITLTDARIVSLTGSNYFATKKLLGVDDTTSNYLLYCPISHESQEENWLLDIELYSEEFRADMVSMWMDEMGIAQTPALRKGFKQYRKFFNARTRRKAIMNQPVVPNTPAQLQMSIMAALAGIKNARPNPIIKEVLKGGLDTETNAVYKEFVNYGIDEAFWRMVAQGTGYEVNSGEAAGHPKDVPCAEGGLDCGVNEPHLGKLATHILLTATTRTMRQEFLAGLDSFISGAHQAYCYDFVSDWLHSDETVHRSVSLDAKESEDSRIIHEIAEYVEAELRLPQRFMKLKVVDLVDTEVFPCINEVILVKLMKEISDHIIDVDVKSTVEKRRTCVFYDEVKNFYDGILQVANMQAFYKTHSGGFHTVEPKKIWEEYTSTYYVMDTCYRLFHLSYEESLKTYHAELSDLFASVMEKVEGLYTNWFLGTLGKNWSDAASEDLSEYGRILEVPEQKDFYRRRIASSDSRMYVIISDAMRYEVAASLADQLRRETQAKVDLKSMQGIFPTITKFGMAALLPHKKLSVELKTGATERLAVLADGQSTESNNRDKLLKQEEAKSVALKYKDIIGMKRAGRQSLVKGMDVVYIYHDTIDKAGHLEKDIFGACGEAIDELKNMVRIIANEFGGANILITSDHGFLYTRSPLDEDDKVNLSEAGRDTAPGRKVDQTGFSDRIVEYGRRFAIMMKGTDPDYLQKVKFLGGETDYDGFAPRENIRIKMKGGGMNFVHGGISLQEMVVPVIEYHFLRNDSKEYKRNRSKYDTRPVSIALLSASHKISNMIFSLNFYQKDAVSANREAATCQLYFTDSSGKTISDVARIIADKTSDNAQDRTFRCNFNLKSLKYSNTETYYLVIADEDGLQISREEFQIDIAFAVDEFDFFS